MRRHRAVVTGRRMWLMWCLVWLLQVQLLLLPAITQSAEAKRIYFVNVAFANHTWLNHKYVDRLTIGKSSHQGPAGLPMISAQLRLLRNLTSWRVRLSFDMLRRDNTKINLLLFDLDGCRFLANAYDNIIMQIGREEMMRVSNLPKRCPVLANVDYAIRNYTIDPDKYPPFVPTMTWLMTMEFWVKDWHEGDITISGKVRRL